MTNVDVVQRIVMLKMQMKAIEAEVDLLLKTVERISKSFDGIEEKSSENKNRDLPFSEPRS